MDISRYDAILSGTIRRHLTIFVVVGLLLTAGLILNLILYRKTTKKLLHTKKKQEAQRIEKQRSRLLVSTIAAALCIPICGVLGYLRVADMRSDLKNHSYREVVAAYERPSHRRSVTDDGVAYLTVDGEKVMLYLPASAEDFPTGEHYGAACYAEESRVLLRLSKNYKITPKYDIIKKTGVEKWNSGKRTDAERL